MRLEPLAPALTEAELRAFEAGARLKLPQGLRDFYLAQNGGLPPAPMAVQGHAADLEFFCPLVPAPRTGVPGVDHDAETVWFARDSAAGRYGIGHRGPGAGRVVWQTGRDAPRPLAESLAGFLNLLEG